MITKKLDTNEKIESLNKKVEDIKKNQMEIFYLKYTIIEMKNSDELNSRMERTEERINEFDDRTIKITQYEQREIYKEKIKEQSLRDYNKRLTNCVLQVQEAEVRETERVFEKTRDENFPDLEKQTTTKQPINLFKKLVKLRINSKKSIPGHIIIKLLKTKGREKKS